MTSRAIPEVRSTRLAVAACRLSFQASPFGTLLKFITAALMGGAPLLIIWATAIIIDAVTTSSTIWPSLIVLAVATFVAAALSPAQRWVSSEVSRKIKIQAQRSLFTVLGRCRGIRHFENPSFHNRLLVAQHSGEEAPAEIVDAFVGALQGATTSVGLLLSLFTLNWGLALVVLLAAIPGLGVELSLARQRARQEFRLSSGERRRIFYQDLLSSPKAAKELRLYGLTVHFKDRMLGELTRIEDERRRLDLREARLQTALAGLASLVGLGAIAWAAIAASHSLLTPGELVVLFAAIPGVQMGVQDIVSQSATAARSTLLFGHYQAIIAESQPDLAVSAAPVPVPTLRTSIELQNVWFRYAMDRPWVLRGVNLVIPANIATALVGRNGSGKSTLIKLLCRFYDPDRGRILWDGIDIRTFDVDAYRNHLSSVFQDFMEYDLSARENIELGDIGERQTEEAIVCAARRAGAHEAITALPEGYDTPLTLTLSFEEEEEDEDQGDEADVAKTGVQLSGGQWQRLALARAFYRQNRDFLILDEPSAGLDAEAESALHQSLVDYRRGRTSLLVSHRMGALQGADFVASLDGGQIVECGSPTELLRAEGLYASLFHHQAEGYLRAFDGRLEAAE